MQIILAGAGKTLSKILQYKLKENTEILFVCDNDKAKWGQSISGYKIVPMNEIRSAEYDFIIMSLCDGMAKIEITDQLMQMGVAKNKIVYCYDAAELEFCESGLDDFFDIPKIDYRVKFQKNRVTAKSECGGETAKSKNRRLREGFFEKYCVGEGLDIGCGADPITENVSGWDILNGDAQYLRGIDDEEFDFVYSSHCLEHMRDVRVAIKNWYRVVRKGGFLIIAVPDRDLYEKKSYLPSRWNGDHKHMFLLGRAEEPDTLDILEEIKESIDGYEIIYAKICDEGHTNNNPLEHSDGEYQIEIVIKKNN